MALQSHGVAALERLLRGELDAVIFEASGAYVQFAGGRNDIRCEAAGDRNLAAPLTFEQLRELAKLRFYPPERDSAGNHWQQLEQVPPGQLLSLAVDTLHRVYGCDPAEVTVTEV